ncbi:hypothetical protein [Luteimicrobium subarcticum]|uniref:Uncharacterized protein n=1 Tax=Luteimicrobium subarcticum TaxID=620910 RepID=A0A2M8WJ65_9MICO|nr:hypothetical protein [Luteimicrobium subarcticum]PJI90953.1 hypothetical protein CLV34_2211 [Luteimicrobium subarcticum]
MGMGTSRGTAYAGVGDVLLEHVMDTHLADELEDALRPGTSAIVVVAEDRAEASPVVAAVAGADAVLWDRELGQDEQVLRS